MSWSDGYALAILGGCAQRALDGARAAAHHVRAPLRRFREAVGAGTISVGPVQVSLAPAAREVSRIATGHAEVRRERGVASATDQARGPGA